MSKLLFAFIVLILATAACSTSKQETASGADSVAIIDSALHADKPAPASLAFTQLTGYAVKNNVALQDSINFILIGNQEELDKQFSEDKTVTAGMGKPDFIINYVVAAVCLPSTRVTSISLEKVEMTDTAMNVYVNLKRAEQQAIASKATQIFAIERRDGVNNMQFWVNGKKEKSFFMSGL
ncbi:MAG TPA: hypothetical protein VG737_01855 [Cyclobacteriaceae bacterium]|nr:hypothetical protein [Cyclobacteriaceae bacterium]